VEIAVQSQSVVVRDSKDVTGPVLRFAEESWTDFLAGVRSGRFDRPTP
jgi:hypothetical protein